MCTTICALYCAHVGLMMDNKAPIEQMLIDDGNQYMLMTKEFDSGSMCSDEIGSSDSYYDPAKPCKYWNRGIQSHDKWCANCKKPRAVKESRNAAQHRVQERLKLVSARYQELLDMSYVELDFLYYNTFKCSPADMKYSSLLNALRYQCARDNRPSKKYRLANKIYEHRIRKWTYSVFRKQR